MFLQTTVVLPLVLPEGNSRWDIGAAASRDQDVVLFGKLQEARSDTWAFDFSEQTLVGWDRNVVLSAAVRRSHQNHASFIIVYVYVAVLSREGDVHAAARIVGTLIRAVVQIDRLAGNVRRLYGRWPVYGTLCRSHRN